MALTNTEAKQAKPSGKNYKLSDSEGLYLEVMKTGAKYWRLKYRFGGKEKRLAFGVYPVVTLKEARLKRAEAKKLLSQGIDPNEQKKANSKPVDHDSFEIVAREWHQDRKHTWSEGHGNRILTGLEKDIFPWVGKQPINKLSAPDVLSSLRRIQGRGALDTAHRAGQNCSQIFRYAVAIGKAERDPVADLKGALPPVKANHYSSITDPKKIGELLRVIDGYHGHFVTKCAMRLAPLLFVRPGELRHAEWNEIDIDNAEWKIPADKMKMKQVHIVPLSKQVIEILNELKPLTGRSRYVFPSIRTNTRPMSENTITAGLRRLGYTTDEMTGHGFRSMASTILNEQGWNRDAIERQLAHSERDSVRAAYNYAEHLPERRKMMAFWSDYLDSLKNGG